MNALISRLGLALPVVIAIAALSGCAGTPVDASASAPPSWSNARQMVVVTSVGWDEVRGTMRRFERADNQTWRQVGASQPVMLGRSGIGWGIGLHPAQAEGPQKREGDGRGPAGVFAIGPAFGYAGSTQTSLQYLPMQATSWCMDVPASPLYNRIVDSRQVGEKAVEGSSERMRLDLQTAGDERYKLGFVIQHNPRNVSGMGSCIFAHLWGDPDKTTAGCTAMDEPAMRDALAWLSPAAHPVLVQLTNADYDARQAAWRLPARADFR